ncbi:hypothetical protein RYX56_16495 [Alkalihalophilus lindianensis]|uniref:Uncharacterized protein n=1 Tax=Alkalihalophilus lindianensis TaxID=1630542 RepID=A0ABU3XFC1_9BACI|nr:hypothetical protein [Alkalihalophilus lindianensis]MDV2685968.1 hypothetical protein [Alkalihalophilus lindianensis]
MAKKGMIVAAVTTLLVVGGAVSYYMFGTPTEEEVIVQAEEQVEEVIEDDEDGEYDQKPVEISDHPDPELMAQEADFLVTLQYGEYEEAIAYQPGQETKANKIIATQHTYLNKLAGWGRADSLNYESTISEEEWNQLRDDINWLYNEGFADSHVKNDMKNARAFMYVAESRDAMALRYLHRIFHDLDAEINGNEVDKIWQVTHSFGKSSQHKTLHNYLKGS